MIRHIVMWKLQDTPDKYGKAMAIKNNLESLKSKIDVIRDIEVGVNLNGGETASDVVLVSTFDNEHDLHLYAEHPSHKAVAAALVKPNVTERRSVDYEF